MKISVAKGDGIGKEVMGSVLDIFNAAGVPLEYEMVAMGKEVALAGEASGISAEARESVETNGILFKGPMETPKGGGYKSVNVTARKMWGTFANKRVFRPLPGVPIPVKKPNFHLRMVRENIEDTYGGIEHLQTHDVSQCRRLITRPGCEQVHRYTFEMAKKEGSRRVTCAHKANIMKLTDGMFLDTFYEVAKEYPEINADDMIIDALSMRPVLDPTQFDIIVLPNLQGDIVTDLAAGIAGGLAYAPSANIGDSICIFEAVHGTAPDIVGQDLANPSALLLSGIMMLRHLELENHAKLIEDTLYEVLQGIYEPADGKPIGFRTSMFTERMVTALEAKDGVQGTPKAHEMPRREVPIMRVSPEPEVTKLRGVDVFLDSPLLPNEVAKSLETIGGDDISLTMISNRGTQVWPTGSVYTDCINHHRCRFEAEGGVSQTVLLDVMRECAELYTLCGAEWLRELDGERGYSLAQGQS
jgi:isocitrate dehydrogenase